MLSQVALAARCGDVQSKKRVGRQVVVEADISPPGDGVTFLAGLVHRRTVRVVGAVAACAVRSELVGFHRRRVTGVTVDLGMRSGERKLRVLVAGHPPNVVAVTISARGAQAALMAVVSLVATGAALRNGSMEVPATVTVGAPDMGMTSQEGKTRLTGVIELLRIPVSGGMTVATLLALATFVNVVRCVATETFCGHVLIFLAGVTCRAGCLHVFAGQCKGRLVMVEARVPPRLRVMTRGAIGPQRSLVRIILRVAATTDSRSITIDRAHGLPGLVTALAARGDVRIVECEVREVVGKSNLAETRDIGVAAKVLGVTSTALTSSGLPHAPVITAFRAHIFGDFFVTAQALRVLPLAIGEIVALRAFGLDPGVRLGDRTGHHELFDTGSPGPRVEQQHDGHENQRSRVAD